MAREEESRERARFASTVAICASIIAAIRLALEQNISGPSPRIVFVISESVSLARLILKKALQ